VERGRFRSDLYFRLNVAQLSVPPLRLRRQDLPALVDALVRRFNATADRPVTGVAPAVMDLFFDHAWPGNLRELENKVARALILADGGELRTEHVDLDPEAAPTDADRPAGAVLNERQIRALEELSVGERITSADHARAHGISTRTALRDLLDLVDAGYLAREGEKRGVRFRRTARPWAAPSVQ
jgi:DNA-binding NtrC family response regulator